MSHHHFIMCWCLIRCLLSLFPDTIIIITNDVVHQIETMLMTSLILHVLMCLWESWLADMHISLSIRSRFRRGAYTVTGLSGMSLSSSESAEVAGNLLQIGLVAITLLGNVSLSHHYEKKPAHLLHYWYENHFRNVRKRQLSLLPAEEERVGWWWWWWCV